MKKTRHTRKHMKRNPSRSRRANAKRAKRSRYSRKGGFGGVMNPFPPGGPYQVGSSVNGLEGGYYYKYNMDPTLQTRILSQESNVHTLKAMGQTLAPNALKSAPMRGGKRHRRKSSRKSSRKMTRKSRRVAKSRKPARRRTRSRRGGSGLKSLVPSDILDIGRGVSHGVGNLYRGFVAEKPTISPDVMVQPTEW